MSSPNPDPMPISERELRALTDDLADAHHETLPSMRDSLEAWRAHDENVESGITHLVSTPASRRAFLFGGGAVLGGLALAGSGAGGLSSAVARMRSVGVPAAASAQKLSGDLAVVGLAAALENLAVATYEAGIDAATKG